MNQYKMLFSFLFIAASMALPANVNAQCAGGFCPIGAGTIAPSMGLAMPPTTVYSTPQPPLPLSPDAALPYAAPSGSCYSSSYMAPPPATYAAPQSYAMPPGMGSFMPSYSPPQFAYSTQSYALPPSLAYSMPSYALSPSIAYSTRSYAVPPTLAYSAQSYGLSPTLGLRTRTRMTTTTTTRQRVGPGVGGGLLRGLLRPGLFSADSGTGPDPFANERRPTATIGPEPNFGSIAERRPTAEPGPLPGFDSDQSRTDLRVANRRE